jgi:DNA-directed RNA polymerase-3 subunit RPC5
VYHEKLFVKDTKNALQLRSALNNAEYLDAISAPTTLAAARKKTITKKDRVDLANETEAAPARQSVAAGKAKASSGGVDGR